MDERGADLSNPLVDYVVPDSFLEHPVADPSARFPFDPDEVDRRHLPGDPRVDLPDYSGPFREDLRFTDFSEEMLLKMLDMNVEYRRVWVGAWLDEAARAFGRDERLEIEWLAWRDAMVPKLEAMMREYLPPRVAEERLARSS